MAKKAGTVLVCALAALIVVQGAQAGDWKHGIGTGFFALNLDGDVGLTTVAGPVTAEVDLDNSDVSDLMQSAFGFGGFAAKGKWSIHYGAVYLELEGDGSGEIGATPVSLVLTQKTTKANLAGEYGFAETDRNKFGVLFGAEYTKHDYDAELTVGMTESTRDLDHDWVDAVVGLTHAFDFSEKTSWSSLVQGAFGGSEGTFKVNTGLNWHFAKHWMLRLYFENNAVDYENDDEGDPDWYLYDVDEFGAGLGITYLF